MFSLAQYILTKYSPVIYDVLIPIRHVAPSIQAIQTQCVLSDVILMQY